MQSNTFAHSKHRLIATVAVHQWCVTAGLCELQKPIGVIAVPSQAELQLECNAALLHTASTGSLARLLCISGVLLQGCVNCTAP